jgi:tight adherence protein B
LRRQVKTLSAEGVLSAWILALLPLGVAFFVTLRNPGYLEPMYTTLLGWVMIAVGAVLYVIGILWLRNLVRMEI